MSVMRAHDLRALFPALARVSYLNAAAASPISLPIEKAIAEHTREIVEWGDVGFRGWLKRKEEVRTMVAKAIGATAEEIAFTQSTSAGFNIVGAMLRHLGVREVVTLEGEFPSTTLPLLHHGLRLRIVPARPDGTYAVEDIADAVRKRTGAIAASYVQYGSGARLDLEKAGALCRSRKLLFAVNACQAMGQLPVDVEAARIDFLCSNSHKWLMAGFGAAFFFAKKKWLSQMDPIIAGWLSAPSAWSMNNLNGATVRTRGKIRVAEGAKFRREAMALEAGVSAWSPCFGLGAAMELIGRISQSGITAHIEQLQRMLRGRLRERGFVPTTPDDFSVGSGICSVNAKGSAEDAVRELAKLGVLMSARADALRISTHAYNSEEDIEQLCWALEKAAVAPA